MNMNGDLYRMYTVKLQYIYFKQRSTTNSYLLGNWCCRVVVEVYWLLLHHHVSFILLKTYKCPTISVVRDRQYEKKCHAIGKKVHKCILLDARSFLVLWLIKYKKNRFKNDALASFKCKEILYSN